MTSQTIQQIQNKLDLLLIDTGNILEIVDKNDVAEIRETEDIKESTYSPDFLLSKNFPLRDLIRSKRAIYKGISNMPGEVEIKRLIKVAQNILQPCRDHYGVPILPNSGYRSPLLNGITPNASKQSQHMRGQAVDFEVPGISNIELARWIRNNLDYDKIILEFYKPGDPHSGWVHCSYKSKEENRHEVYTTHDGKNYIPGIVA